VPAPPGARDFDGRTVLLTGAGRTGQVGEAVARAFAQRGADVILIDRERADERARELDSLGTRAHAHACDLADAAAVERVRADVEAEAPEGLAAVVLLAGGFGATGPIAESDPAEFARQITINLTTAYLTTRAFLPLLRKARGSIVYFASAAALPGASVSQVSAYAAAKSGVVTLMRAVAAEERDHGVRANALAPTNIRTTTNVASMGSDVRYVERETVAHWVLHLVDPDSGPVTGQVIKLG
jgi:NAD(P)-dependent dehydrogenase (short-subunit alcohol dehydrogenase family)